MEAKNKQRLTPDGMPKRNLEIKCYFFVMSSVVETSLVFSEIIVRDSSTALGMTG
jgi:hypothetical protein